MLKKMEETILRPKQQVKLLHLPEKKLRTVSKTTYSKTSMETKLILRILKTLKAI